MSQLTLLHNPRCSKSRQALELLQKYEHLEVREYLNNPLSEDELLELLDKLQLKALDVIRGSEKLIKEEGLNISDDAAALKAMTKYPKLMQRPIVITQSQAFIARPPERINELL